MTASRAATREANERIVQGLNLLGIDCQITRFNDIIAVGDVFTDEEGVNRAPVLLFTAPAPEGDAVVFRIQQEKLIDGEIHQLDPTTARSVAEAVRTVARMMLTV